MSHCRLPLSAEACAPPRQARRGRGGCRGPCLVIRCFHRWRRAVWGPLFANKDRCELGSRRSLTGSLPAAIRCSPSFARAVLAARAIGGHCAATSNPVQNALPAVRLPARALPLAEAHSAISRRGARFAPVEGPNALPAVACQQCCLQAAAPYVAADSGSRLNDENDVCLLFGALGNS